MVYLYAGLGVVMLSGIMAIFEMGLSLTGQSLLPMPNDTYVGSPEKEKDMRMVDSLDPAINPSPLASDLEGMDICNALEANVYALNALGGATETFLPNTLSDAWNNGCVIQYGSHQILVMPRPSSVGSDAYDPELSSYLIVSCTDHDKSSSICPFKKAEP